MPLSYDYNSNLSYCSFLALSKLLNISTKNDENTLQNYIQKLYNRFNEAKNLSFFNDKEKQKHFQEYLCLCLNEYCKEGNNNANLLPEHIIYFFRIIENFFEFREEIFEIGLTSLSCLTALFSTIKNDQQENEFNYILEKTMEYIITVIVQYKDTLSRTNSFDCLSNIIHTIGKKIEKYINKIINISKEIIFEKEVNKLLLGKILIISFYYN